jgi:16S rRNA (guanine(1405)-N(7))-methyltransferase
MSRDVGEQAIVERIRAAPKYRDVHVDTIADIVAQESAKASSTADLERRARLKLHRVVAGYLLTGRLRDLARGFDRAGDTDETQRELCRAVLAAHFSTAERLPDLDRFYPAVMGAVGAVRSVADLACALNPFSVPWLRDVTDAEYAGYDLNLAYVELGNAFLAGRYPNASVFHRDVLVRPDAITADVALVLKTYHNMEDRQRGAGLRLVAELGSPVVVVSLPVRTMTGRPAPFSWRLVSGLTDFAAERGWPVDRVELSTELVVVVRKSGAARKGGSGAPTA